jgi:hypothetical protein
MDGDLAVRASLKESCYAIPKTATVVVWSEPSLVAWRGPI